MASAIASNVRKIGIFWNTPLEKLPVTPLALTIRLLLLNLFLCLIVIPLGYFGPYEEPGRYFREGRLMTWLSFFQLLGVAYLSQKTYLVRRPSIGTKLSHPTSLWRLGSWAFIYLAFDEMLRLHENIDRYLFHKLFRIEETPLTDHIDDVVIICYGIVCLVVLYKFRTEILKFLSTVPYLLLAIVGFGIMAALDVITDGDHILKYFIADPAVATAAVRWLGAFEDVFKNLSECFFIGFFAACYAKARMLGTARE